MQNDRTFPENYDMMPIDDEEPLENFRELAKSFNKPCISFEERYKNLKKQFKKKDRKHLWHIKLCTCQLTKLLLKYL